jgi:putative tryptophan/tyrosine transport system substrate-binding protein
MIGRREFITLLGGAVTWPLAARAQQPAVPVIGFLHGGSPGPFAYHAAAFRNGLGETGYIEGRNVAIEYRWVQEQYDRLPALVADLVQRRVAVIATGGGAQTTIAASAATANIPIVFTTGTDPVKMGLVTSLNRPERNITGVTFFGSGTIGPKQMELLHELAPRVTTMGVLINPGNPNAEEYLRELHAAADTIGVQLKVLNANTERDLQAAFDSLAQQGVHALLIGGDPLLTGHREQLVALAARYAIPTIYLQREFVTAGGLITYVTSQTDAYRLAGVYTGRILKGEKPGDLPVQQPTKFELVINLTTAQALGLAIPPSLLAIADEVIE